MTTLGIDFQPPTQAQVDAIRAGLDVPPRVTYQANSNTFPANPRRGDWLVVTEDGTDLTDDKEVWHYNGVRWRLFKGAYPVSAAIIDNTIGNSANITAVGRYIVPTTNLAGQFVGRANQYADFDGTTFTFTAPADNTFVTITSGPNAGQVWSFRTATGWAATAAQAANRRLFATRTGTNQTVTLNNNIVFNSTELISGITYDTATGIATLPAGGVYELEAGACQSGTGYFDYRWRNITANAAIGSSSFSENLNSNTVIGFAPPARAFVTAVAQTQVSVRVIGLGGAAAARAGYCYMIIKQIGTI